MLKEGSFIAAKLEASATTAALARGAPQRKQFTFLAKLW